MRTTVPWNVVAFTTDLWKSRTSIEYITFTCSWIDSDWVLKTRTLGSHSLRHLSITAEVLEREIPQLLEEYSRGSPHKITRPTIVSDCGSNIRKCLQDQLEYDWIRCSLHLMHNIMQAGLSHLKAIAGANKNTKGLIGAMNVLKSIAHQCRKSSSFKSKFCEAQLAVGGGEGGGGSWSTCRRI